MTDRRPDISAVIPTYNRCELLADALESFKAQSLDRDRFEVVVVNDGSQDDTEAVCQAAQSDLNLTVVNQRNSGSSAAKNMGIFTSRAPIVFFSDDDDVASPTLLEEHLRAHDHFPDSRTAILSHTDWNSSLDVTPCMDYLVNVGQFLFSYPSINPDERLGWRHFWTGRLSCRRSMLVNFGVFSVAMRRVEDIELGYRLSRHGLEIRYWPDAVSFMNRPITFQQFCKRMELDARSLADFRSMHDDPEVEAYCTPHVEDLNRDAAEILEQASAGVEAIEPMVRHPPRDCDLQLTEALHVLYRRAFFASAVIGFSERSRELDLRAG
jgi:glycosyltransferase involved in cell wall biosynthesis